MNQVKAKTFPEMVFIDHRDNINTERKPCYRAYALQTTEQMSIPYVRMDLVTAHDARFPNPENFNLTINQQMNHLMGSFVKLEEKVIRLIASISTEK